MNRNEVIEWLYNLSELDECITKMVRPDHRDDFKHELFIKIYDIPEERLIGLYERNELRFYIVRVLINLVKNKGSVYNKAYINPEYNSAPIAEDLREIMDDAEDIHRRRQHEEKELEMISVINNQFDDKFGTFYYRNLVHLIAKHGSMRAVSRLTGIPIASISEAVKKTRVYLNSVFG